VERDLVARPLLAPLSVTPADLLAGKVRALRRSALLVGAPLVLLPFANLDAGDRLTITLRVAATLAGLWVATDALVSVSFLTSGIGAGPRAASGTGIGLDRLLVLVPTLSIATAPTTWAALVALGSLALLAAEARRSALHCVRWIDDDEDFARETPVWRALLVFAAFSAVQGLTAGLTALTHLAPLAAMAVVYLVAAVALVALTARERSLATIALWPERTSWLGAGALVGAGVAAFAVAYQTWVAPRLGITFDPLDAGSMLPFSLMAIAAAPVAEELFFRGWLQDAILRDHAARGPAFGIAVTAFAFASIHPPGNFAAPLVLGLATGWLALRSRSIGPGIVAHAMMNAAAILARAYLG
jgi:membrane protease YdiL (CAAX protease family)